MIELAVALPLLAAVWTGVTFFSRLAKTEAALAMTLHRGIFLLKQGSSEAAQLIRQDRPALVSRGLAVEAGGGWGQAFFKSITNRLRLSLVLRSPWGQRLTVSAAGAMTEAPRGKDLH